MGIRNMLYITKCKGKEYNIFLFNAVGIRNRYVVNVLQFIYPILFVFNVFVSLVLTLCKFFVSLVGGLFRTKPIDKQYDELFLNFMDLFTERVKSADLYCKSNYWVIGPNVGRSFIPKDKNIIDYRCQIDMVDNFKILKLSLSTIWNYLLHGKCLCLVHKAWQFYEAYVGLSKITQNSNIYFSNQSDKYAILFDNIPSRKKILLQHGIALNWGILPCPLRHIDIFYAISEHTWQDAFAYILIGSPQLKFFNPTISLTDFNLERKSVLIVSEVTYFEQEVEILKALSKLNIEVFLKRHPGFTNDQCYRDLQSKYKFCYITDKVFPKVDFVVSYFSTLVFEYMEHGIPVYMYNSKEDFSVQRMLGELRKTFDM